MLSTIRTLVLGTGARMEEEMRDAFSIELIEQKIREAQQSLTAAKSTLASLIQRHRNETRQVDGLETRIADMIERANAALRDGNERLATEAADAIAQMEHELATRRETADRLEARLLRLRQSIETAHRRIIDLKQGAVTARAIEEERRLQKGLTQAHGDTSAVGEAEALIARVMSRDDPFERGEILREIEAGLDHSDLADRMADAGYGQASRSTGADVLKRLKADLSKGDNTK